jgi:hypothetical protein
VSGFQLYYSGLCNITDEQNSITAPVQNFMEHYKTAKGETALTSSSFIMLLAFNDTVNSIHDNWPDRNDTLYASFSLGLDLNTVFGCARTTKGVKLSDVTIHQFLEQKHIKMSIVLFQNSLTLNQSTKSTYNNQNVTDAELDVSNGAVTTTVGNDKIFETEFGTKPKYSLYNIIIPA